MDRNRLLQHLALAEKHVSDGELQLANQRRILAQLRRDGHHGAAADAERLLRTFEDSLAIHVSGRDRLREELAALD